jgi:DNA repair exonuclease SbcCD nuclease subunit
LFRFVHAADLHIDSPLIGLAGKSEALAELVDNASRRALDNLVALAIEEHCSFIVIAGDLFDGEWRDYHTGIFFVDRMRQLRDAGIPVFIVLGNHDAENRFTKRLEFSDNVRVLSTRQAETIRLDGLAVAIHGQSFPRRDVTDNLAVNYPKPVNGFFNVGLLHTACTGREGHQRYAPCSTDDLISRGYDYWALGHVHKREILSEDPPIVFPGNLQGRNAHETGPKGATLVTVDNGHVNRFEHRPLDTVRWAVEQIGVGKCRETDAILAEVRELMERSIASVEGRALALRLFIREETPLHDELVSRKLQLSQDIETEASAVSSQIWIEKIELKTNPPKRETADPTIAGRLQSITEELSHSKDLNVAASEIMAEIRARTPAGVADDAFFDSLIEQTVANAAELAKAIAVGGEE